ncbi:MAG TPA: GWxTD domain-containing protein [Gemmatimonadales bacterium]
MRRHLPFLLLLLALPTTLAGCGQWQRVGDVKAPNPEREVTDLFNPAALFTRLGRIVSNGAIGFVGSTAFLAGPGDSTCAVVAISLANRSFAFERNGTGYGARYRIEFEFDRPGAAPVFVTRDKSLLVGSFQETLRTDESVIEQQRVNLIPGSYTMSVRIRDLTNATAGAATARVVAPSFPAGSITAPILIYQVRARQDRDDSVALVLNPRGTVSYGGDTLVALLEANGLKHPTDLPIQVRDDRDSLVFRSVAHFAGRGGIETFVLRLAPDSAPLGQLEIITGGGGEVHTGSADRLAITPGGDLGHRTSALVSFSGAWVVSNFDELLSLLRYFGQDRRITAMRHARNSDRVALWQDFFKATDPNPSTPENEALDLYFSRIATANERFRESGRPGWRTDRGEVFITLGEPDHIDDQSAQLQNSGKYYGWEYQQWNIEFYFQDINGFGQFQLTPASRSDFDRVKTRVQRSDN